MSRAIRLQDAARLNSLARELGERWRYEDQQATFKGRSNESPEMKAEGKKHRQLADEIAAEAQRLTKEADEIYKGLRG